MVEWAGTGTSRRLRSHGAVNVSATAGACLRRDQFGSPHCRVSHASFAFRPARSEHRAVLALNPAALDAALAGSRRPTDAPLERHRLTDAQRPGACRAGAVSERAAAGGARAAAAAQAAVNWRMSSDSVSGRGRRTGSACPKLQRTAAWVACGRRGTLKVGGQSMAGGPQQKPTGAPICHADRAAPNLEVI